jgi:hypothetical protein
MSHEEIKRYFDTNPPPEVVQWKLWAKISDTQLFLSSCYTGIRNYNGPLEMCPAWWHLKDFYQHIRRNIPETTQAAQEQPE